MDIFFDTTVLVAASEQSHPHYAQARPALLRVAAGQDKGFMGLHSIAEVFAALTRLPVQPRIHPVEAARIVTENILPHFEVVSLGKEDYLEATEHDGERRMERRENLRRSAAVLRGKMRGGAYLHLQSRGLPAVGAGRSARENMRAMTPSGTLRR